MQPVGQELDMPGLYSCYVHEVYFLSLVMHVALFHTYSFILLCWLLFLVDYLVFIEDQIIDVQSDTYFVSWIFSIFPAEREWWEWIYDSSQASFDTALVTFLSSFLEKWEVIFKSLKESEKLHELFKQMKLVPTL